MPHKGNSQNDHNNLFPEDQASSATGEDAHMDILTQHMVAFRQLQPPKDVKQQLKEQVVTQFAQESQEDRKRTSGVRNSGFFSMWRSPRLLVGAVTLFFIIIVSIGASFNSSAVRASMEAIYEYMGISFVNTEALRDTITSETLPTPVSSPNNETLEEARERVPFHIGVPERLPEGLELTKIHIKDSDPKQVYLQYTLPHVSMATTGDRAVLLRITDAPAGPAVPASRREDVQVHQSTAVFVHGGWNDAEQGDPETVMGDTAWDDRLDINVLVWEADGVHYWLETYNTALSRDDVITLAESIK